MPVTDADRQAAQDIEDTANGCYDWPHESVVEIVARHREAAERQALERAAKEAEATDIVGTVEQWRYSDGDEIAQAIRALMDTSPSPPDNV